MLLLSATFWTCGLFLFSSESAGFDGDLKENINWIRRRRHSCASSPRNDVGEIAESSMRWIKDRDLKVSVLLVSEDARSVESSVRWRFDDERGDADLPRLVLVV